MALTDRSPALAADGADLLALVELALAEARTLGAAQAEAAVSMDVGLSVSARLGAAETVQYQRARGMGVTVYFGTRKGTASTADLSPAGLRETVAKACSIARFTAEDPCAGLPEPDMLAKHVPDLDLSHPWDITPERACEMAIACEAAAMAVDPRITNSEGAGVSTHRGLRAYGNSHGFLGAYPGTAHSISCSATCSPHIRLASSGSRRPATPAATTICSCRVAAGTSTPCSRNSDAACTSRN